MNSGEKYVPCPVCQKKFLKEIVETHVNKCLEGGEETSSSDNRDQARTPKRELEPGNTHPLFKRLKSEEPASLSNNTKLGSPSSTLKRTTAGNIEIVLDDDTVQPKLTNTSRKTSLLAAPLPERVRPTNLTEFIGQEHVLRKKGMMRSLLQSQDIPSMILWGPPGCGKTTLAKIVCKSNRNSNNFSFVSLSATASGKAEMRDIISKAKNAQAMFKKRTVLFIDEIHHYNKLQQDVLLPYVENGIITLIGATTENPSFSLNSALLSRCQVIVLEKLNAVDVEKIVQRALSALNVQVVTNNQQQPNGQPSSSSSVVIEETAVKFLANMSDGDARTALNKLEMAVQSASTREGSTTITVENIREALLRTHVLYDKTGEEHFNCISAMIKSMRGSDDSAALYWMTRMLQGGEDALYISRRLIAFASEDIGLADPMALVQATTTHQSCLFIGKPACEVVLAQCVIYLSRAPKSKVVENAHIQAKDCIANSPGPLPPVPLHLRNAPTQLMKKLGYGKGYIHDSSVPQTFLPAGMEHVNFFR